MSSVPRSPDLAELEARMRPGALSEDGFLGARERLEPVLAHDGETLDRLGVTCEELAGRLEALIGAALKRSKRRARVGPFEIEVVVYTGFQLCPWTPDIHAGQCTAAGGVAHASVEWRIRNSRTGQALQGPGLITHLIRAHAFFEGKESPHRVDPEGLVQLLDPGKTADRE